LTSASLALADLAHGSLRFTRLVGTAFSGADIDGATFTGADTSQTLNLAAARNRDAVVWGSGP